MHVIKRGTISQSQERKKVAHLDEEKLPLLHNDENNLRDNSLLNHPFIQRLRAIYNSELLLSYPISLGEAIIIVGSGFPENLAAIINWSKWLTLGNMALGAALGIHQMENPASESRLRDVFQAIMSGVSSSVFLLQTQLAVILLSDKKKEVNVSDKIFYAGIDPFPVVVGLATTFVLLCKYKPKELTSLPRVLKFLSYLGLQSLNTGSTIHTGISFFYHKSKNPVTNYNEQFQTFYIAGLIALGLELPRIADALPLRYQRNKFIELLMQNSLPRKIISTGINLISIFNYAQFWIMLYLHTQPEDKNSKSQAAQYDFQVLALMLIVMSPVLAALVGASIQSFMKTVFQFISNLFNSNNDKSDFIRELPDPSSDYRHFLTELIINSDAPGNIEIFIEDESSNDASSTSKISTAQGAQISQQNSNEKKLELGFDKPHASLTQSPQLHPNTDPKTTYASIGPTCSTAHQPTTTSLSSRGRTSLAVASAHPADIAPPATFASHARMNWAGPANARRKSLPTPHHDPVLQNHRRYPSS